MRRSKRRWELLSSPSKVMRCIGLIYVPMAVDMRKHGTLVRQSCQDQKLDSIYGAGALLRKEHDGCGNIFFIYELPRRFRSSDLESSLLGSLIGGAFAFVWSRPIQKFRIVLVASCLAITEVSKVQITCANSACDSAMSNELAPAIQLATFETVTDKTSYHTIHLSALDRIHYRDRRRFFFTTASNPTHRAISYQNSFPPCAQLLNQDDSTAKSSTKGVSSIPSFIPQRQSGSTT